MAYLGVFRHFIKAIAIFEISILEFTKVSFPKRCLQNVLFVFPSVMN